jgi:hypothetical protein
MFRPSSTIWVVLHKGERRVQQLPPPTTTTWTRQIVCETCTSRWGGKEDAPELVSELSSAFIADTTTDEMCVGSDDDLEGHLARVAMHWLDEGRSSPSNLVGGGDTESSNDRMSLEDVERRK